MLYTPPRPRASGKARSRPSPAAFCRPRAARTVCVRPVRNAPCLYCRCDRNAAQLEGAAANADAAARQGALPLLLMHADATRLPLHDGSVDAVLSDLPFGRKHGRREGLYAAALREWRRVLRPGGCAVLLTTRKAELAEVVSADPAWAKVGRHHLMIGALMACAHVLRRQ